LDGEPYTGGLQVEGSGSHASGRQRMASNFLLLSVRKKLSKPLPEQRMQYLVPLPNRTCVFTANLASSPGAVKGTPGASLMRSALLPISTTAPVALFLYVHLSFLFAQFAPGSSR